jgi:hypothetical protein
VVIFDDTVAAPVVDPLVCYTDLGADTTISDGQTLTIQINASGIYRLSGAET